MSCTTTIPNTREPVKRDGLRHISEIIPSALWAMGAGKIADRLERDRQTAAADPYPHLSDEELDGVIADWFEPADENRTAEEAAA